MEKINAPFTKEQVDKFNVFQLQNKMHPFTCVNDGDASHIKYEFEKEHTGENYEDYLKTEKERGVKYPEMKFTQTNLIATENGWVCPVCGYKQNWSHSFMMDDTKKI